MASSEKLAKDGFLKGQTPPTTLIGCKLYDKVVYFQDMGFTWNLGKNTKLKEERGISFEEVVRCIISGNFKVQRNASRNHPGQDVFEVRIKGKAWRVPFKRTKRGYHLFTIFPKD